MQIEKFVWLVARARNHLNLLFNAPDLEQSLSSHSREKIPAKL